MVGELDMAGDFVPGQMLPGEGDKLFRGGGMARLGDDEGRDQLPPLVMGDANDARGRDTGMLLQHIFHFGGVHIFAAGHNEITAPLHQP